MSDINAEKMRALLDQVEIHMQRLSSANGKCSALFPMDEARYRELDDAEIEHIDQLLYRFTKLQDALGAKLFPAIVSVLREDADALTIFDTLAVLERAGAIPDQSGWMHIRELRNQITHEYENDAPRGTAMLNGVYDTVPELLHIAGQAKTFTSDRILPSLMQ